MPVLAHVNVTLAPAEYICASHNNIRLQCFTIDDLMLFTQIYVFICLFESIRMVLCVPRERERREERREREEANRYRENE